MKGFDADYADLPDHDLKNTARNWEARDFAALDGHCVDDLLLGASVHASACVDRFWVGLRAALPSSQCKMEYRFGRADGYSALSPRLSETTESRRLHTYRQSRRSRRLNLRPPN